MEYKEGDWVVVLKSDFYFRNCEQNQAQQIIACGWGSPIRGWKLSSKDGSQKWYYDIRPATMEEIVFKKSIKINNNDNYKEISMNQIKEVLEKIYDNLELRRTIVPLFISNPGTGKTVMIENFAKDKGVHLVELITSQMSPFEVSGIAMK